MKQNLFREDLFHRLNVMRIEVPPLRGRREDVPALLDFYLQQAARELSVPAKRVDPAAGAALASYEWPGNVRELVNCCRRLTVTAAGREIGYRRPAAEIAGTAAAEGVPEWLEALNRWAEQHLTHHEGEPLLADALPALERTLITAALEHTKGRRQEAARLLGWGRNTLTRKIRELEMDG